MGENCLERHLHPSIYEKMAITEFLLQEGADKKKIKLLGGLDLETYKALKHRWEEQENRMMQTKKEALSTYGSLKKASSYIGPCKEHESVIGTKNALVLLVEFKDKKHSHDPQEFKDLLFSKGSNRSMRDYYLEASWNQLDINGDVNDKWYTLTDNRSEYSDSRPVNGHYPKAQRLVKETIQKAKSSGKFDFNSYSKDGKIEIIIIIFAGSGMDTKLNTNFIRPHQDQLTEPIEVQNGIWVDKYCIIPELPADDLGCFCHEVGHFLGLPDLYKEGYSPIVGSWCLMGIGCYNNDGKTPSHPSAWCKLHLGWTEPKILNQIPDIQDIPAVIDNKTIYKIEIQGTDKKEYFLLENRQQKGFDEDLPYNGLLIWHVNEKACVVQAPNFDPNNFFITLKQSDGKEDLQKDRTELIKNARLKGKPPKDAVGDSGDPFPGITLNRTLDDESNPNSRSYKGKKSFINIDLISDSKDVMTADIGINSHSLNFIKQNKPHKVTLKNKGKFPKIYIHPFFFKILYAIPKEKTSYEKEFENVKEVFYEELKDKSGIKSYQIGYRSGFKDGYDEVLKSFKKRKI